MILAAATKFRIEATGRNVVLCGARHADIYEQLEALEFGPKEGYKELEQGFITHEGKFLSRPDAWDHAVSCGQVPYKIRRQREEAGTRQMISEDLW